MAPYYYLLLLPSAPETQPDNWWEHFADSDFDVTGENPRTCRLKKFAVSERRAEAERPSDKPAPRGVRVQ